MTPAHLIVLTVRTLQLGATQVRYCKFCLSVIHIHPHIYTALYCHEGEIRLIGGTNTNNGRVEIYFSEPGELYATTVGHIQTLLLSANSLASRNTIPMSWFFNNIYYWKRTNIHG